MRFPCLSIIFFLQFSLHALCQEYGYSRYGSKEGLAGATVYCMTQDKEGFMWFGTETGLSRFDGTHFKNFTKEDGLPDNEVIQLFADSKGRVWIAPFKKTVCYYYKGKIYTPDNDPRLKQLRIAGPIIHFTEDAHGNLLMHDEYKLHLINVDGQARTIDSIDTKPIGYISTIACSPSGAFRIVEDDKVWDFDNNRFTLIKKVHTATMHFHGVALSRDRMIWRYDTTSIAIASLRTGKTVHIPFIPGIYNFIDLDSTCAVICTSRGARLYDISNGTIIESFLNDVPLSGIKKDREGNIWFTSLGQGVYRLNSAYVKNIRTWKNNISGSQVLCLGRYQGSILVGSDNYIIYRLDPETGKPDKEVIALPSLGGLAAIGEDPLNTICTMGNMIFCATRHIMGKALPQSGYHKFMSPITVKALFPHGNKLLVATRSNVLTMDPVSFTITDTLWRERSTTVFADHDTVYIGTLNGLYYRVPSKPVVNPGEHVPELNTHISGITKDGGGTLWIATYGEGVFGYRSGKIIARVNKLHGLSSNICRTMYLHGHALWVGTDKGLNKIALDQAHFPVQKYTTGDGLISDIINVLYVDGSKVYVGTPDGLTFFDEQRINRQSTCDLVFTGITIGNTPQQWDSTLMVIPHNRNNIRFDYVAISFKSAGDIRYRYRLLGLDSNWNETRETFLQYPTLPSGDYELQLQAVNKFDRHSKIISARFTIEQMLWEKTWFRLLAGFVFLGITGLLVWLMIHRIRKREQEKTSINKKIGDLEQLARKAQMNPHFIFNSLNSIQQYVMDSDLAGANKFISGFSRLIRQTLNFSSRQEISLEEELDYLKNYLELEKTRLEDAFSWQVVVEEAINPADYYLPPMILQPFVENSVRHGLRYRKDQQGKLLISVRKENEALVCIVEDNGIGRKAAQQFKSSSHIEYQSKGMSLTAERIAMLNKDSTARIVMQIEDLEDKGQHALGTRVTLRFPISV